MRNLVTVALNLPIYSSFDYIMPDEHMVIRPGSRVEVPFGNRKLIGIILNSKKMSYVIKEVKYKLKNISKVIDDVPILPNEIIKLCLWCADYYQFPVGQVIFSSLPPKLRKGKDINSTETNIVKNKSNSSKFNLNKEQISAFKKIKSKIGSFSPFLLEGVTGSGKTELYVKISEFITEKKGQVLIIVPEINLTPQTLNRFEKYLNCKIDSYHSSLSDQSKLKTWRECSHGNIDIVIGTRSSIFIPFKNLQLIIIDEEHDLSLKQSEKFRYHARDVALIRSKNNNIPIIMGSATPSFESLYNCSVGKYTHLALKSRYFKTKLPSVTVVDLNKDSPDEGFSSELIRSIQKELDKKKQIILYIGRRGFSHTLLCTKCGWTSKCLRCDAHMTYHLNENKLWCHHCGFQTKIDIKKPCGCSDDCEIIPLGQGTERVEAKIKKLFPNAKVMRIDSDVINNTAKLNDFIDKTKNNELDILIGTQMLVKGHDFPGVTLVGIMDIDAGLYSLDFRGLEKIAQLIVQVSGRSGRHSSEGKVLIQTRKPKHPLIIELLKNGYNSFSNKALLERKSASLPPFSYISLFRVSALNKKDSVNFLSKVKGNFLNSKNVKILGPSPAPITKKNNRYFYQLLLSSSSRKFLLQKSYEIREYIINKKKGNIRWSLDIDPLDLY